VDGRRYKGKEKALSKKEPLGRLCAITHERERGYRMGREPRGMGLKGREIKKSPLPKKERLQEGTVMRVSSKTRERKNLVWGWEQKKKV